MIPLNKPPRRPKNVVTFESQLQSTYCPHCKRSVRDGAFCHVKPGLAFDETLKLAHLSGGAIRALRPAMPAMLYTCPCNGIAVEVRFCGGILGIPESVEIAWPPEVPG